MHKISHVYAVRLWKGGTQGVWCRQHLLTQWMLMLHNISNLYEKNCKKIQLSTVYIRRAEISACIQTFQ